MTRVLTDPYKNKLINKDVVPVQKHVQKHLDQQLATTDKQAEQLPSDQVADFLTQANQQNADYAQNAFKKLNQKLTVDATRQTKVVQNKNL